MSFLQATLPAVVAIAVATALLRLARTAGGVVGPTAATLFSAGGALLALQLVVVLTYGVVVGLQGSIVLLLGAPIVAFGASLATIVRRRQFGVLASLLWGGLGVAGLYLLGGFVLMSSVCSFSSGGC